LISDLCLVPSITWFSLQTVFVIADLLPTLAALVFSALVNYVIEGDKAKVIDRKSDKYGRHIREMKWIKKTDNMNRDEGSYQLSHV